MDRTVDNWAQGWNYHAPNSEGLGWWCVWGRRRGVATMATTTPVRIQFPAYLVQLWGAGIGAGVHLLQCHRCLEQASKAGQPCSLLHTHRATLCQVTVLIGQHTLGRHSQALQGLSKRGLHQPSPPPAAAKGQSDAGGCCWESKAEIGVGR
jgi:hypothetical protein